MGTSADPNVSYKKRSVAFSQIILAEGFLQQAFVDLTEGDRQRLVLALVLDQRADVLQQSFVELGEVGVDLTCALRSEIASAYLESACFIKSSIDGVASPVGVGSVPNAICVISKHGKLS